MLFADVSGSMDLAEQQDPEEWRKIMQRFFSILADAVTSFEGTVDKFTGDGIMAVFGAPVAHEDHARRACYAALQMLDDVAEYAAELRRGQGLNFSTRIGINSGEVVAGAIGQGGDGDYTAIGHTVGLAQRMEALAEPGKAYLTEHTAELAAGFLDLDDLGEFEIKGASRPVRVFELAGVGQARSRLDLSRERGFSRFVGRAEEMAALEEALERADGGRGRRGRHRRRTRRRQEPALPRVRRALPRARGSRSSRRRPRRTARSIPVHAGAADAARLLRRSATRDPEQLVREKIAGRSLLLDPELRRRPAADVRLPRRPRPRPAAAADERRGAAAGAGATSSAASSTPPAAARRWSSWSRTCTGSTRAATSMLASWSTRSRARKTLAVVNFRPEYTPPWRDAPVYRETLAASRSAQADTRELLRDLAGEDPSLDGLDEPIHERTQGNPFFIEEIVRELAEAGHLEGERGAYRLVAADRGRRRAGHRAGGPRRPHRPARPRRPSSCCRSPRWSARRSARAALGMTAGHRRRARSSRRCAS